MSDISSSYNSLQAIKKDALNSTENDYYILKSEGLESELEFESEDEFKSDGGIERYKELCHELKIVPISIVLKSLMTTSISLSNYGISPNNVLALTHALKVTK